MAKFVKTVLTTVMAAVLCAAIITYCMSVASAKDTAIETETLVDTGDTQPEISMEEQLFSMLNINYCYGLAFDEAELMAQSAAVTLSDYAEFKEGIGFCVNASLVSEFMATFYGISVEADEIYSEEAKGFVVIPNAEMGTMIHTPVSTTEAEGVVTVISCMEIYFGGDDMETFLAKSKFKANPDSPFGYSLIFSEIL